MSTALCIATDTSGWHVAGAAAQALERGLASRPSTWMLCTCPGIPTVSSWCHHCCIPVPIAGARSVNPAGDSWMVRPVRTAQCGTDDDVATTAMATQAPAAAPLLAAALDAEVQWNASPGSWPRAACDRSLVAGAMQPEAAATVWGGGPACEQQQAVPVGMSELGSLGPSQQHRRGGDRPAALHQSAGVATSYSGPLDCARKTLAAEGWRGFMKGWTAQYVRLGPHTVLTFVVLEQVRPVLARFDVLTTQVPVRAMA